MPDGSDHRLLGVAVAGVGRPARAIPGMPAEARDVQQAVDLCGRQPKCDPDLGSMWLRSPGRGRRRLRRRLRRTSAKGRTLSGHGDVIDGLQGGRSSGRKKRVCLSDVPSLLRSEDGVAGEEREQAWPAGRRPGEEAVDAPALDGAVAQPLPTCAGWRLSSWGRRPGGDGRSGSTAPAARAASTRDTMTSKAAVICIGWRCSSMPSRSSHCSKVIMTRARRS